jgi:glycosyltransferase involved in cell wall biosynthesis
MKSEASQALPLISCLCITENRPVFLNRAIACFCRQTYKNKQLVILYKENDLVTKNYIDNNIFQNSIKTVKVPNDPINRLGAIRNISVQEADGEYICIWDDDDWYHMDRLSIQYYTLVNLKKQASVLSQYFIFDAVTSKVYLSFKRNYWENSLLSEKSIFLSKKYPNISKGEDTFLVDYLFNADKLSIIDNKAYLYVYTYHGCNTCDHSHFLKLFARSVEIPSLSKVISDILGGNINSIECSKRLFEIWSENSEEGLSI